MSVKLVACLGTGDYRKTLYEYDGRQVETRYAPVAVAQLCGETISAAVILATEEAREQHFASLEAELDVHKIEASWKPIPKGMSADEIETIVQAVDESVGGNERVVLDVTHGYRHAPLILFASLLLADAKKKIELRGLYYCMVESRSSKDAPASPKQVDAVQNGSVLSLGPLFRLVETQNVISTLAGCGDLRPLAKMIGKDVEGKAPGLRGELKRSRNLLKKGLVHLSNSLTETLPLETGLAANEIVRGLEGTPDYAKSLFVKLEDWQPVLELAQSFALPLKVESKNKILLDDSELERQLRLCDWYEDRGNYHCALLVLREWLINFWLLRMNSETWLDREERKKAEAWFGQMERRRQAGLPMEDAGALEILDLWKNVSRGRNHCAHVGMSANNNPELRLPVRKNLDACRSIVERNSPIPKLPDLNLLVCPMEANRPGALFTALKKLTPRPQLLLILAFGSLDELNERLFQKHSWGLDEILKKAGFGQWKRAKHYQVLTVVEAAMLASLEELEAERRRVRKQADPWLARAGRVTVCATGGTSLLRLLAQQIGERAREIGTPGQMVWAVSRRHSRDQETDPLVEEELLPWREWGGFPVEEGNTPFEESEFAGGKEAIRETMAEVAPPQPAGE